MKPEPEVTEKPALLKLAEKLTEAQQELDELAVQLALGKAEAKDKFEEVKEEFRSRMNRVRHTALSTLLTGAATTLKAKIESLELQLALGKAETREAFAVQHEKILQALKEIELEIQEKFHDRIEFKSLLQDVENFKLKLEILRLKVMLKRFELNDEFRDKMLEAKKFIEGVKEKAHEKLNSGKETFQDVKDDVEETYHHLRKALKSFISK